MGQKIGKIAIKLFEMGKKYVRYFLRNREETYGKIALNAEKVIEN